MSVDAPPRGERALRTWDRVWFSPGSPATLEAARWLVFTVLAVDAWHRRHIYRNVAEAAPELWDPVSLLGLLPVGLPHPAVIEALLWVVWIGAAATLLRVAPRVSGIAAASAGTVLVLMTNSFGKISHDQQMVVIMAVVLAAAAIPRLGAADSWRFRWPVQLCRAAFGVMLFSAAVSKVRDSGLDWVFSSNLRNILVMDNLLGSAPPLQGVALWIASEPWLWQAAAAGTIVGEAILIVAVVARHPAIRVPAIVAGVGTVIGITLLMGLVGFPFLALAAIFVEVDAIVRSLRSGHALVPRAVLPAAGVAVLALVIWIARRQATALVPLLVFATAVVVTVAIVHARQPGAEVTAGGGD